jgi:EamA domain-containing membrane protein RarD
MFVGAFLVFVVILHFVLGNSLKLGGTAALVLAAVFGVVIHQLTKDPAVALGASAAFGAYML